MNQNIGYAAYDMTENEEIRIHTPNEYIVGEIVELKAGDYIHNVIYLTRF